MSSLRLAMKKSLEEAGPLNKKPRSNRNRGDKSGSGKRKKRKGDSPRKRGRPKKSHHRPQQGSTSPRRNRDSDDEDHHHDGNHHSSSEEENEFAGEEEHSDDEEEHSEEDEEEEEEEEEEEDDEDSDGHSHHHQEEEDRHSHPKSNSNQRSEKGEDDEEEMSTHADDHQNENESEERHQRKLQKKLKHSAANKIQSQWKKKKSESGSEAAEPQSTTQEPADAEQGPSETKETQDHQEDDQAQNNEADEHQEDGAGGGEQKKKKKGKAGNNERGKGKGKTAKTVPPPAPEVLEWNRALPVKRARKHVAQGLRVKVRFATKVKRDGKIMRKKKWFGGRVSAVSKEGSKIRIKYDDGTAEISKFPDKDVCVCDAFNGQHQCDASKFQPPHHEPGSMVMDEERAPTPPRQAESEKKLSAQPSTAEASNQPGHEKEEATQKASRPTSFPKNVAAAEQDPTTQIAPTLEEESKPKPEARKPSPVAEPMEEEILRAPSPPVPEIRPPSPPLPEIEMQPPTPPAKAKPTTAAVAATRTRTPSPPLTAAVSAPLEEPASPGEIVDDVKEPTVDKSSMSKEKVEEMQSTAPEDSEKAPKPTSDTTPDAIEGNNQSTNREDRKQDSTETQARTAAHGSTGHQAEMEEDAILSNGETETEPQSEKVVQRPSLTIRLPNPNKDRRFSGTEPKSPRIKISTKQIMQENSVDRAGDTDKQSSMDEEAPAPAKVSGRRSPKLSGRKSPNPDGSGSRVKRRRSEEEKGLKSDVEPPLKKLSVQRPAILEEGEEAESQEATQVVVKPKAKRPSSRLSDEQDSKVASKAEAVEDDDGPVKIVARVSARRVPLFSDEEDELEKPKPEKGEDTSVLQKPKAAKASTAKHKEEEVECDLPTKKPAIPDEQAADEPRTYERDKDSILLSSRNSAFDRKDSNKAKAKDADKEKAIAPVEEEGAGKAPRPTTPREKASSALATPVVRSGRRAAQQANERIVSTKQDGDKDKEEKEKEVNAEGKKRKRKERNDEDSESSNEDVNNWVQCFSCKKWRIIPNHISISTLPDRWYCNLNVDRQRNTCEAPEQTAKTPVVKKKKSRRKKKRAAEAVEAANPADQKASTKPDAQQEAAAKEKLRIRSPTPSEGKSRDKESAKAKEKETTKAKETGKTKETTKSSAKSKEGNKTKDKESSSAGTKTKHPRASPNSVSDGSAEKNQPTEPEPAPTKSKKKARRLPDEPLEPAPEAPPERKKPGRKPRKEQKEREEQDQNNGSFHGSVSSQQAEQDPDNVEWVQCDSCSKWRKLPAHISADELPDVWYCKDNTWNPGSASCDAPEDKADGQLDIGPSSPSPSPGKLSYRNLIFGSGRRVNRPVSERTRAAESIFATPSSDESETTYPTVTYANSSVFAPRGSRANIIEDENHQLSVFDLMHHSSLFAELRGACQPFDSSKDESIHFGKTFEPKYTFETVPCNAKQALKDLILECLSDVPLLGEELALVCQQSRQWESDELRAFCTKDLVITLLCELVTEGKAQLVQTFGNDWNLQDWCPRYRKSPASCIAAEEGADPPLRKSRCMKLAKPWRR